MPKKKVKSKVVKKKVAKPLTEVLPDIPVAPPLTLPPALAMEAQRKEDGGFEVTIEKGSIRRVLEGFSGASKWKLLYEISSAGARIAVQAGVYTKLRLLEVTVVQTGDVITDTRKIVEEIEL